MIRREYDLRFGLWMSVMDVCRLFLFPGFLEIQIFELK